MDSIKCAYQVAGEGEHLESVRSEAEKVTVSADASAVGKVDVVLHQDLRVSSGYGQAFAAGAPGYVEGATG